MRYFSDLLRLSLVLFSLIWASQAGAELKELDDEKLEEQKGQAGVTIDLEFEWSIGEMAWQFDDGKKFKKRQNQSYHVETAPRIQYVLPGDK